MDERYDNYYYLLFLILHWCTSCHLCRDLYFLFPNFGVNTQITNVQALLTQTEGIYNYHSTLTATHPYTSEWYTWPIMWKPVWYYVAEYSDGLRETISGIGNPAIWGAHASLCCMSSMQQLENAIK